MIHLKRTAPAHRLLGGVLFCLPLLLAVWLYAYSVTLPFFLDDGPHFQILDQTDGLRHWGDFPAFPFYRPLTFTIWKMMGTVGYSAPFMHLLNVLCFGLAGVLVGQITYLMTRQRVAALLAGCLFVLFPFSYQAVAMVAAFFHLMLALGVLLCLWAACLWLDGRGGWGLLLVCWLGAFMAAFSHESGVLVVPLLSGMIAIRGQWRNAREALWVILPVLIIVLMYGVLWLAFRPQGDTQLNSAVDVSLAVMLQGLIYPIAALIRPLVTGDIESGILLLLVSVVILIASAYAYWLGRIRAALFGLGWYILAILPAALLLPAGYVLGQTRLALLASAGGAIFWGVVLGTGRFKRFRIAQSAGVLVMVVLFIYVSLDFLAMRRADFLHLRDFNRVALRLFDRYEVYKTGAILVNAPDYVIPAEADRRFLLGTEGVLFVDETLDYNQQFWMNSDTDYRNIRVIAYDQIQRNQGYGFRAHPPALTGEQVSAIVQDAPYIFVTHFSGRQFWPELVGGTALPGLENSESQVMYPENGFVLTNSDVSFNMDDYTIQVETTWRVTEPAPVKLFIHVYCDERFIAQSDGYPWGDTYPFAAWSPDERQTDVRTIALSTMDATPECLKVYTGLYRETDGTRLEAVSPQGIRYPDDQYLLELNDDV